MRNNKTLLFNFADKTQSLPNLWLPRGVTIEKSSVNKLLHKGESSFQSCVRMHRAILFMWVKWMSLELVLSHQCVREIWREMLVKLSGPNAGAQSISGSARYRKTETTNPIW